MNRKLKISSPSRGTEKETTEGETINQSFRYEDHPRTGAAKGPALMTSAVNTAAKAVLTNLHGSGGGHGVVAVHEDFRLNDGHKPRLLHGARVTRQPPCVLL